jgi:hypothetical protein
MRTAKTSKKASEKATTAADGQNVASKCAIRQVVQSLTGIEISGDAMIQNAFSQKALEQMLRKHMGITVTKELKQPRQCVDQAHIRNVNGVVCIPPQAVKSAMLTAWTSRKPSKKQLQIGVFIVGGSLPIRYESMIPRMDIVRLNDRARNPDIRFRPMFMNWSARLLIAFNPDVLNAQSVVDLVGRAGKVGVGEWRPEKNGTYGTFAATRLIQSREELKEVEEACRPQLARPEIPEWAMDVDFDDNPALLRRLMDGGSDDETLEESHEVPEDELDQTVGDDQVARIRNKRV